MLKSSDSRYSMSRTCGPRDVISLVIPRLGDNISEVVIVLRVNAEADSAPALLLGVNVTQMCVGTVGLGNDNFLMKCIFSVLL
jgi:hypothetical protein